METKKPVVIRLKMKGGEGSIIPRGMIEQLTIEVIDEVAYFHFLDWKTTKMFAITQNKDGVISKYSERLQKTSCLYPGMDREAIAKHIKDRLNHLQVKK
jgi:hypothetical protein